MRRLIINKTLICKKQYLLREIKIGSTTRKEKPTETEHKDISEKNKNKSIKEDELLKDAKLTEAIKSEPDDREEESPKRVLESFVW